MCVKIVKHASILTSKHFSGIHCPELQPLLHATHADGATALQSEVVYTCDTGYVTAQQQLQSQSIICVCDSMVDDICHVAKWSQLQLCVLHSSIGEICAIVT